MQDVVERMRDCMAQPSRCSDHEIACLLDDAIAEVGRLRNLVQHHKAQASAAMGADPRIGASPLSFADRMNDFDRRIAELESRVRLTQHRLAAAAQMCADIDRDPRMHSAIQVALSQVGKALKSQPEEDDSHV